MTTMNISLPSSMRRYVDKQVRSGGYGTSSEYVRDLIREDQARKTLRDAILDGLSSGEPLEVSEDYWKAKLKRAVDGAPRKR